VLFGLVVFRNFGLFNFAGTFPELTENLRLSSAELTNRDSRSSLPDPTRWPNRAKQSVSCGPNLILVSPTNRGEDSIRNLLKLKLRRRTSTPTRSFETLHWLLYSFSHIT
jgi:hypothetical protein